MGYKKQPLVLFLSILLYWWFYDSFVRNTSLDSLLTFPLIHLLLGWKGSLHVFTEYTFSVSHILNIHFLLYIVSTKSFFHLTFFIVAFEEQMILIFILIQIWLLLRMQQKIAKIVLVFIFMSQAHLELFLIYDMMQKSSHRFLSIIHNWFISKLSGLIFE